MKRGKGLKFVGDSRIQSYEKPKLNRDYSEFPGRTEEFYPDFLLKEWLTGAVFLVGFLCLIVADPAPLERMADATDTGYIPLPDWYFLFVYQLLKYSYASGAYNIIGALVMPGIAFTALLLMPFLDTTPERRPSKRPLPTAFMLLSVAAIFYLTWESVEYHDWEAAKAQGEIQPKDLGLLPDVDPEDHNDLPGYEIWMDETGPASSCIGCHATDLSGNSGPMLLNTGLDAEEIEKIAKDGRGGMPAGAFGGTDEELKQVAEFIAALKEEK